MSFSRIVSFGCFLLSGIAFCLPAWSDDTETPSSMVHSPDAPAEIVCFADASRGRPLMKDPSVVRLGDKYFMYYSLPPHSDPKQGPSGWTAGIAVSDDLIHWRKAGEILPEGDYETKGLAAPDAMVHDGKVHLFYQTYGNGRRDAICHAVSDDGIHFQRDPSNPIFRPTGDWNCGRAIDAETAIFGDRIFLYFATRDPEFRTQMLGVAAAPLEGDWGRDQWQQLGQGPLLRPELPWETRCIEAPTVCRLGERLFMFFAGGYNNDPQQIGAAVSDDGVTWRRLSDRPLVPNGGPDDWNHSESGHPGIFVDNDGRGYLFYQGNRDHGRSWYIACKRIELTPEGPRVVGDLRIDGVEQ